MCTSWVKAAKVKNQSCYIIKFSKPNGILKQTSYYLKYNSYQHISYYIIYFYLLNNYINYDIFLKKSQYPFDFFSNKRESKTLSGSLLFVFVF